MLLCILFWWCVCVTTQGNGEYEGDGYEGSERVNALFMMLQFQLSTEAFTAFSTLVLLSLSLLLYIISTWHFSFQGYFLTVFKAIWPLLWFDVFTRVWQHSEFAWKLHKSAGVLRFRRGFTLKFWVGLNYFRLMVTFWISVWLRIGSFSLNVDPTVGFRLCAGLKVRQTVSCMLKNRLKARFRLCIRLQFRYQLGVSLKIYQH